MRRIFMPQHKSYLFCTIIVCILTCSCLTVEAQEISLNNEASAATPATNETQPNGDRILQWAWEFPKAKEEAYPISQYSYWRSVGDPFGAGFRFLHYRDEDNGDEFHFGGYGYFRPIVLDFNNFFISLGGFLGCNGLWTEYVVSLNALNQRNVLTRHALPVATGLSLLLSLPEEGIQMTFELGHVWRRLRVDVNDVAVAPIPGFPTGHIKRIQKDSGINMFYEFTWVTERQFFPGISINVIATYITGPITLDTKLVHSLLGTQKLDQDPERGSFISSNIYIKAVAFELPQVVSLMPAKSMLLIEPAFAVSHFASDHGHGLSTGVRVSIFDMVRMYYLHSWDRGNQEPDSDIFAIEIGFKLGRGSFGSGDM